MQVSNGGKLQNYYEYFGLSPIATQEEIERRLKRKVNSIDNRATAARSSQTKILDLEADVVHDELSISFDIENVEHRDKEIFYASRRIAYLDEELPVLLRQCQKNYHLIFSEHKNKTYCSCLAVIESKLRWYSWPSDVHGQMEYMRSIKIWLEDFETMYSKKFDWSSNATKQSVIILQKYLSYLTWLYRNNIKAKKSYKHSKDVKDIQKDASTLATRIEKLNELEVTKEILKDITEKQEVRVKKDSIVTENAERVLIDKTLRMRYNEYINQKLDNIELLISADDLQHLIDHEERHKNDILAVTQRLENILEKHKNISHKIKKKSKDRDQSKYKLLYSSIMSSIDEKIPIVMFNPLKLAFNSVVSVLEQSRHVIDVFSNNKSDAKSNDRKELFEVLKCLNDVCENVYKEKNPTDNLDINENANINANK